MVPRGSPGVVCMCSDRICLAVLGDDQSDIDPTDRPTVWGTAAPRAAVTAFLSPPFPSLESQKVYYFLLFIYKTRQMLKVKK